MIVKPFHLAVVVAAQLAVSHAHATSIFVAPLPGADDASTVLTRTIETAVFQRVVGVDIVTPHALEAKLDTDLAKACTGEGDDASCVVEFAQAMGVDFVLRPQLAKLGDARILTISLYSGKRAALLGQAQQKAAKIEELVDDVPALVVEAAKSANLRVVANPVSKPTPYLAYSEIGAGAVVVLASAGVHAASFAYVEPQYEKAAFDKGGDETWEAARPFAYALPVVGYVAGIGLVWLGVASMDKEAGE